ncbi:MAG: YciI family protein [Solirubrobacteraceae bacterium]
MSETWLLRYTYVPDIVERRGPHREAHLAAIAAEQAAGRVSLAGALGDPPSGGAIAFTGVGREHVQRFAAADPYVRAGLVTEQRIEPWTLVGGSGDRGA